MILARPYRTGTDESRWHWFISERVDARGELWWVTACNRRLTMVEFQAGHPGYITCQKCREVFMQRIEEEAAA